VKRSRNRTGVASRRRLPRQAKTACNYAGHGAPEISEEPYSDDPGKLSDGMREIFDAVTGCPESR
jgi:hypothetical protein